MPYISKKQKDLMEETSDGLLMELEKLKKHAFLVGIERNGRKNVFTFARNGEMHTVETMGLISDDLPEWKEKLLR